MSKTRLNLCKGLNLKSLILWPLGCLILTLSAWGCLPSFKTPSQLSQVVAPHNQPDWIGGLRDDGRVYIHAFDVTPQVVRIGDPVVISWFAPGADSVDIIGVGNNLPPTGHMNFWPSRTETYQMIARRQGERGEIQVNRFLTIFAEAVVGPPAIWSFRPERNGIKPNELTNLRWRVAGCTTVRITTIYGFFAERPCILEEDVLTVNSPETVQFTIELYNSRQEFMIFGSTTLDIVPEVKTPIITRFETSERQIVDAGSLVTILWETLESDNIRISPDPSFVGSLPDLNRLPASGQIYARPTQDTTYILTATNNQGRTTTRELRLQVSRGPHITEFTANPPRIPANGKTMLQWSSQNCVQAELSSPQGKTVVPCQGSQILQLTQSTTFNLVATSAAGATETKSFIVAVDHQTQAATIEAFTATSTRVRVGTEVTLVWSTQNAGKVEIIGLPTPQVQASGSMKVVANATTTLIMRVYNPGETVPAREWPLTIEVYNPVLQIKSFSASSTLVPVGGSTTLSWNTTGCRRVVIQDLADTQHGFLLDTTRACKGTVRVPVRQGATFRLYVSGVDGQTASQDITIVAGKDLTEALINIMRN